MTAIDYVPLLEGDTLNAASLNDRFAAVEDAINDIPAIALERHALRTEHIPSMVNPDAFEATSSDNYGLQRCSPEDPGATQIYGNKLDAVVGPVWDYQLFSTSGGAAPYGPVARPDIGWRIISDDNLTAPVAIPDNHTGPAEVYFKAAAVGNLASYYFTDLLVELNVGLISATYYEESGRPEWCGVQIGIGFLDDSGDRYVIERSVRWFDALSKVRGDLETFTLITQDDLTELGDGTIASVFGVIAGSYWEEESDAWETCAPEIDHYHINMEPFRAGSL